MTLHAETAAQTRASRTPTSRSRLATYSKNHCPQCAEWLLAPDWSEYFNERCVRHTWSCQACGYEFETAVFFAPQEAAA
jgi:C4-type Zn-finger protein